MKNYGSTAYLAEKEIIVKRLVETQSVVEKLMEDEVFPDNFDQYPVHQFSIRKLTPTNLNKKQTEEMRVAYFEEGTCIVMAFLFDPSWLPAGSSTKYNQYHERKETRANQRPRNSESAGAPSRSTFQIWDEIDRFQEGLRSNTGLHGIKLQDTEIFQQRNRKWSRKIGC